MREPICYPATPYSQLDNFSLMALASGKSTDWQPRELAPDHPDIEWHDNDFRTWYAATILRERGAL